MTAEGIADIFQARTNGRGRWMAKCPAHDDSFPSLSVKKGKAGRVLVHCFAGCSLKVVLKAAGLEVSDLFEGPPSSSEGAKKAAQEREMLNAETKDARLQYRKKAATYRKLFQVTDAIGEKLARMGDDDPSASKVGLLYHQSLHRLRCLKAELVGGNDERL